MDLKEKIAQAIDMLVGNEKRTDSITNAVLAVLRDQEPVGYANGDELANMLNDRSALLWPCRDNWRAVSLYPAPVPHAGDWIAANDVARMARELDVAMNGEVGAAPRPSLCDVIQQACKLFAAPVPPAESAVPDGWRQGVAAVAEMIQKKADDYAQRFGRDDLGGLSFGQGSHAHAKLEYHSDLCELAEEVRAMLATAPKPEGE